MNNVQAEDKGILKQIDHIGIAVRNLNQSLEIYEKLFRAKATHFEVIAELSLRIAFIPIGEVMIELLEPIASGKGRLSEFLETHGEGLHHIAYKVDNLAQILAEMKKNGVKLRDEKPRVGAHSSRIAFISPEETNNVLTELVER